MTRRQWMALFALAPIAPRPRLRLMNDDAAFQRLVTDLYRPALMHDPLAEQIRQMVRESCGLKP